MALESKFKECVCQINLVVVEVWHLPDIMSSSEKNSTGNMRVLSQCPEAGKFFHTRQGHSHSGVTSWLLALRVHKAPGKPQSNVGQVCVYVQLWAWTAVKMRECMDDPLNKGEDTVTLMPGKSTHLHRGDHKS